ncbi:MAG TPA: ornithine cyclodeaminase family protein [Casimicrobiaceae bacterium]|nr:ornithine cyclodeaminase family protein [Casimicrobiaceae bacterium]
MSLVPPPALIIRGSEVAALMDHAAYLTAVEAGFRSYANGDACVPMPMHIPAQDGGFHAKGALVVLDRPYVAVKVNGNFPENPHRTGLPTIQGAVLLFDAAAGSLLAVIDSIEITLRRTAAASALAARYLARADADSIAICGCGDQGRSQLAALAEVVTLKRAFAWDISMDKARDFAREMRGALGLEVTAVPHVYDATRRSDIIVTATSAQRPFLTKDCVSAGTFVAAVGADSPNKSELAAELLAASKVVVDVLAQCAVMGDLHHALDAGLLSATDVHAELGDLVVGRKPGRTNPREITVFDSTGVAVQDAASAAWVYQRAVARNIGMPISLGAA